MKLWDALYEIHVFREGRPGRRALRVGPFIFMNSARQADIFQAGTLHGQGDPAWHDVLDGEPPAEELAPVRHLHSVGGESGGA